MNFNYSRSVENRIVEVRENYLKMLEDRLKQLDAERQLFPQQILAKLKEIDDHLNGIVHKNQQLYETVKCLTNERQILENEIKIMRKLCVDHDEMARKYMRAKKFHHELIHQKHYLMTELNAYESVQQKSRASHGNVSIQHKRKKPSFKSIALAAVAIMRMKIILQKK